MMLVFLVGMASALHVCVSKPRTDHSYPICFGVVTSDVSCPNGTVITRLRAAWGVSSCVSNLNHNSCCHDSEDCTVSVNTFIMAYVLKKCAGKSICDPLNFGQGETRQKCGDFGDYTILHFSCENPHDRDESSTSGSPPLSDNNHGIIIAGSICAVVLIVTISLTAAYIKRRKKGRTKRSDSAGLSNQGFHEHQGSYEFLDDGTRHSIGDIGDRRRRSKLNDYTGVKLQGNPNVNDNEKDGNGKSRSVEKGNKDSLSVTIKDNADDVSYASVNLASLEITDNDKSENVKSGSVEDGSKDQLKVSISENADDVSYASVNLANMMPDDQINTAVESNHENKTAESKTDAEVYSEVNKPVDDLEENELYQSSEVVESQHFEMEDISGP